MGLISSNNKRHQQCMNLNRTYPSPNSSDPRRLKRAKFSAMSKGSTPSLSSPTNTGSRVSRYPNTLSPLHREVHAPCRPKKFGLLNVSGTESSFCNSQKKEIAKSWGNDALHNKYRVYQQARDSALACIRLFEKPKEVVQVDTDSRNNEGVLDDGSSVPEVYVIEDDGGEGPSMVTEQSLKEDDMALTGMQSTRVVSESMNSNLNVVYAERMLETLSLSPELAKKEPLAELALQEPFVPLTKEEEVEVERAFSADRKKVLVIHYKSNIEISGETFQCLRPGGLLNDEVIELYLVLLKERERRKANNSLHCHFFQYLFLHKAICTYPSSWALVFGRYQSKKKKKFQYLDSLRGKHAKVLKVLSRYFVDEVKDKTGKDIDVSSWEKEFVEDLPEQKNWYDCGMFMIKYADFYSRNMGLRFSQGDMYYFRLRTAKEILRLEAN